MLGKGCVQKCPIFTQNCLEKVILLKGVFLHIFEKIFSQKIFANRKEILCAEPRFEYILSEKVRRKCISKLLS